MRQKTVWDKKKGRQNRDAEKDICKNLKGYTPRGGLCAVVLNSPSEDGPGIMYIMHIMSPQLQKRKLHQCSCAG
jgi:hypothetical protein